MNVFRLLFFLFILIGENTNGQEQYENKGIVTDSKTKKPIENVQITIKGTDKSTSQLSTKKNGQFNFNTDQNVIYSLDFFKSGYLPLETKQSSIELNKRWLYEIEMNPIGLELQGSNSIIDTNDKKVSIEKDSLIFILEIGLINDIETKEKITEVELKIIGTDGSSRLFSSDSLGIFPEIVLKQNTSYKTFVEKNKYLICKGEETTVDLKESKRFTHEYSLQRFIECHLAPLPHIHFQHNEITINQADLKNVNFFYTTLIENPTIIIQIVGYRMNSENPNISLKRAKSIKKMLIKKGIDKARLKVEDGGFRDYQKRSDSTKLTEKELDQKNRSVSIKVISDDFSIKK